MRNARTRDQALEWLVTHWDDVEQLTGEKSIEDYPRYAAGTIRTKDEAKDSTTSLTKNLTTPFSAVLSKLPIPISTPAWP